MKHLFHQKFQEETHMTTFHIKFRQSGKMKLPRFPMKLKDVTNADGDDREQWKKAMQVELDALQAKGVVVEMTREQLGA